MWTVSDLDVSKLGLNTEQTNQVMQSLTKGQVKVNGYTVEYEVKTSEDLPPSKGIRFTIVQIVA